MSRRQQIPPSRKWSWAERAVSPTEDHFELRYGSAEDSDWSAWVPVARVGRPIKRVFGVQFIIDRTTANSAKMIDAAVKELDFYIVELGEKDPWACARYHCTTIADAMSSVHWSLHSGEATEKSGNLP